MGAMSLVSSLMEENSELITMVLATAATNIMHRGVPGPLGNLLQQINRLVVGGEGGTQNDEQNRVVEAQDTAVAVTVSKGDAIAWSFSKINHIHTISDAALGMVEGRFQTAINNYLESFGYSGYGFGYGSWPAKADKIPTADDFNEDFDTFVAELTQFHLIYNNQIILRQMASETDATHLYQTYKSYYPQDEIDPSLKDTGIEEQRTLSEIIRESDTLRAYINRIPDGSVRRHLHSVIRYDYSTNPSLTSTLFNKVDEYVWYSQELGSPTATMLHTQLAKAGDTIHNAINTFLTAKPELKDIASNILKQTITDVKKFVVLLRDLEIGQRDDASKFMLDFITKVASMTSEMDDRMRQWLPSAKRGGIRETALGMVRSVFNDVCEAARATSSDGQSTYDLLCGQFQNTMVNFVVDGFSVSAIDSASHLPLWKSEYTTRTTQSQAQEVEDARNEGREDADDARFWEEWFTVAGLLKKWLTLQGMYVSLPPGLQGFIGTITGMITWKGYPLMKRFLNGIFNICSRRPVKLESEPPLPSKSPVERAQRFGNTYLGDQQQPADFNAHYSQFHKNRVQNPEQNTSAKGPQRRTTRGRF